MSCRIDWMLPVRRLRYWRRGWGKYEMQCPHCGTNWEYIAAVGTRDEVICDCGETHTVTWNGNEKDPPNDGVWL